MNQKGVKIAALALAGVITCTNAFISNAAGVKTLFPAAGFALIIGDGVPISEVIGRAVDTDSTKKKENSRISPVAELRGQNADVTINTALKEDNTADGNTSLISTSMNSDADRTSKESGEQREDSPFDSTAIFGGASTETESDEESKEDDTKQDTEEETVSGNSVEESEESVSGNSVEETEESVSDNDAQQDFSNLVIARVNNYVNVRAEASEESEIVGKLYNKSVGTLIEEENGWYKIHSGSVEGYVKAEYCVTGKEAEDMVDEVGEKVAVVTTTTLKVRKEPGLDKEVLGLVPIEEELSVLEETDGWVKVSIEEGEGYVSKDYVFIRVDFVEAESKAAEEARLKKEEEARKAARAAANARMAAAAAATAPAVSEQEPEPVPAPPVSSSGSAAGQAVVNYALQFVGNPYVYGGTSLTNGTDCSGFVMSVYANFGVALPHSSSADRHMGYDVGGLANAQPGDLICYSGHVAIYIGNGQIVHASTSRTGIIVSNAGYRRILAVRRIF